MITFCMVVILLNLIIGTCGRLKWEEMRCSSDKEQAVPEGKVTDIGRFPWIGVVQHTFDLGGKTMFAVTTAVLVHPEYAIASAEDISKIQPDHLVNNTKFIVWQSALDKFSLDVELYFLPQEFEQGVTLASIALLMLYKGIQGGTIAPVLPVCLPVSGTLHAYSDLYAVKMNDDDGEIQKEVYRMHYVEGQECEEFYYQNKLNLKKMSPMRSICAAAEGEQTCVWEAGVALVTRQPWGFWKLLGFSVRGPGCSAPARFLPLQDHLSWINEVITRGTQGTQESNRILAFRRVSPFELIMYQAKIRQPREHGMCERNLRGPVVYKDSSELVVNQNFAQGFFFVSVAQVVEVSCVTIIMEVSSRTNAAIWIEHHCHKDLYADREGYYFKDSTPRECFAYFKSEAYVQFNFYFSFRATFEITIYGREEDPKFIPKPWVKHEYTYRWRPTFDLLHRDYFMPNYAWWWSM